MSWLLPASKTDPQAVGVSREHGCSCGGCLFGQGNGDLESFPGEPVARALCPVRTAARHALHVLEPCALLEKPAEGFPLLPTLTGEIVSKQAWVETIEAGLQGLGLQTCDPDGRPR